MRYTGRDWLPEIARVRKDPHPHSHIPPPCVVELTPSRFALLQRGDGFLVFVLSTKANRPMLARCHQTCTLCFRGVPSSSESALLRYGGVALPATKKAFPSTGFSSHQHAHAMRLLILCVCLCVCVFQAAMLTLLWTLKSFERTALFFPSVIGLLILVRLFALPKMFTPKVCVGAAAAATVVNSFSVRVRVGFQNGNISRFLSEVFACMCVCSFCCSFLLQCRRYAVAPMLTRPPCRQILEVFASRISDERTGRKTRHETRKPVSLSTPFRVLPLHHDPTSSCLSLDRFLSPTPHRICRS